MQSDRYKHPKKSYYSVFFVGKAQSVYVCKLIKEKNYKNSYNRCHICSLYHIPATLTKGLRKVII